MFVGGVGEGVSECDVITLSVRETRLYGKVWFEPHINGLKFN